MIPLTFLTFDPSSEEVMTSPPRDQDEHILTANTSTEVIFFGLLIGGLAFLNFVLFMNRNGVTFTTESVDTMLYAKATTVSYLTIAFCQFVNIMSRRFEFSSMFNRNFFTNRMLLGSIIMSILLISIGVYGRYISNFLHFSSIGLVDWAYILLLATVFLGAFEIVKLMKRINRTRAIN